jgi:NAD/NADP transhydrogenase alpha subunit
MNFTIHITGFVALYIYMLAAFAGWVIITGVPAILHTPLMSGSNFVHGIVVVVGGYAVTSRMLAMFKTSVPAPSALAAVAAPSTHVKNS